MTEDPFVLLSGGKDSVTAAHKTMSEYEDKQVRPVAVYLQTGVGMPRNRMYVEWFCDTMDWQLWELRTHEDYLDLVREHGYPGPSQHQKMYTSLKERPISKLTTVAENPHFYTGVRKDESQARAKTVEKRQETRRAVWHAPIAEWSRTDVTRYIDDNDIPPSPLWDNNTPKDCWCGAYGHPEERIDAEAEGYEAFIEYLRGMDEEVETGDVTEVWGWAGLDPNEQRAEQAKRDERQTYIGCDEGCSVRESPEPYGDDAYDAEVSE